MMACVDLPTLTVVAELRFELIPRAFFGASGHPKLEICFSVFRPSGSFFGGPWLPLSRWVQALRSNWKPFGHITGPPGLAVSAGHLETASLQPHFRDA